MSDPRKSKTLEDACRNADGTYNGIRLLSWLSECMNPGKGVSEEEIRQMAEDAIHKKRERSDGREYSKVETGK